MMRIRTVLAAALWLGLSGGPFGTPVAAEDGVTWMRAHVRQRELAMMNRVLGREFTDSLNVPQIVGGTVAPESRWRFLVRTAAHCVDFLGGPGDLEILTGTPLLNSGGTRSTVERIFIHPQFKEATLDFDVALVKLTQPVADIPLARMIKRAGDLAGQLSELVH